VGAMASDRDSACKPVTANERQANVLKTTRVLSPEVGFWPLTHQTATHTKDTKPA
jgi:hypothetical protein